MKGGKALASGSDGCVFDGTFTDDGTFTKSTTVVTKVYPFQYTSVATNEYARMQEVAAATNGNGVVVATTPPTSIATIPDSAWESDTLKTTGACGNLASSSKGPYMGLTLPLISGDLLALRRAQRIPISPDSFAVLHKALQSLATARIVHMDFAARNIFYTESDDRITALLGDFGTTLNLNDPEFDARIQSFIERYRFRDRILACTRVDGLDPIAVLMMVAYDALLRGKDAYNAFLAEVEKNQYFQKLRSIAEQTWVSKHLLTFSDANAEVYNFISYLTRDYRKVFTLFAGPGRTYEVVFGAKDGIQRTLKHRLSKSDMKLFEVVGFFYSVPLLDEDACNAIKEAWFPESISSSPRVPQSLPGSVAGGARPSAIDEFETLEDALALPDPVLTLDPKPAGRRRTQRKKHTYRHKRVKMSRRR